MKPAGLILLVPAGLALISTAAEPAAQPPADTPPVLSQRLKQEVTTKLPAYVPPPANPVVSRTPPPDTDPDVLVLPKVVVQEKRQPRLNPTDLLTTKALYQQLAREYKNSLTGLDAVLNGFSIPLISPSLAARGRAVYNARKLEELNRTIETIGIADPKASIELNKEVLEMQKVQDWNNRLTGGK